jgi:hypothetical protein
MSLFKKAESTSAYLKAGLLGNAGSGKTFTATQLAIGLAKLINERKLAEANRPIFFLDSETGADYITHRVKESGLELYTAKTRAFVDLLDGIRECQKSGSVLIIDSITHFWREFCDAYRRKRNRTRLEMLDWATLKQEWGAFTDLYVNSPVHIVMCGRMGYEYEHETNEDSGKKELIKTGVKMKAETETGYEPSVLVLMEREMNVKTNEVTRVASVLKERFAVIDGASFRNPTFQDFLPHIEMLNLGGVQLGVDTSRTSEGVFGDDGDGRWAREKRQRQIALEEVQEEIVKMIPGQSAAEKKAKGDLIEELFGTRSWTAVENKSLDTVKEARNKIWIKSRGHAYGAAPEPTAAVLVPIDPPAGEAPAEPVPTANAA